MDFESVRRQLADIDAALDEGRYKRGMWQRALAAAESLSGDERYAISTTLTDLSRKVHGLNRFPRVAFGVGLMAEILVLGGGIALLAQRLLMPMLLGLGALVLSLQPTIKVVVGLALGVRYDYAFFRYTEPRFKMRYGTYFDLSSPRRVVLHAAGSIGTPLAMFAGFVRFWPFSAVMGYACLSFAVLALAMQAGAFTAQWMGIDRIAGYRLTTVTSPASAALELKRHLARR